MILNYEEWVLQEQYLDDVIEESIFILDSCGDLDVLEEYLYENYNMNLDTNGLYDVLNEADAPNKPTKKERVKAHFKKHWKKYAAGAAAIGGGAYLAHKKGWFKKKEDKKTGETNNLPNLPDDTKIKSWDDRKDAHKNVANWAFDKYENTRRGDPKRNAYLKIAVRNAHHGRAINALKDKEFSKNNFSKKNNKTATAVLKRIYREDKENGTDFY